jgi:hypothetical protein
MKQNFLTFLFLFLISYSLNAQDTREHKSPGKIGLTFSSFGDNDVIRFKQLDGAASYNDDNFYTLGINYLRPINTWLEFETGIEYANHKIIIIPNLPPNMDNSPHSTRLSLINIPVGVRVNFLKYCFINGGLLLDIDADPLSPVDSQTGIGGNLGFGLQYAFSFGLSVFVNPYLKAHSLIPFSSDNYHQRLMESGLRLGIMYKLN